MLLGKILNWFLNFSYELNQVLNNSMFRLIGIAYLVMGFTRNNKFVKIVILLCGVFSIAMNFFSENIPLEIVGIFSLLSPILITPFYKEKNNMLNVTKR